MATGSGAAEQDRMTRASLSRGNGTARELNICAREAGVSRLAAAFSQLPESIGDMEENNETIDPRCLQQPPLAGDILKELDVFGVSLYAILTIMTSLSMLVFIDGAIYIYRKVQYPKKTAIIWINGAAPVISTMSCLGMWIPRATMFTEMTSGSYFSIVVYQFLLLLIAECGGDEAFLQRFGKSRLKISTGPCCCCCLCLPTVPITWRTLFLLKLTSFQFALMKPVLTIVSIVLWSNENFNQSHAGTKKAVFWISLFLGALTILALWPVVMMFMHLCHTLTSQNIIPKYAMYQLVLLCSQLQTVIINLLARNDVIGCAPPYSSQARGSLMNQQLLILEMFIITMVTRGLYRRTYKPLIPAEVLDSDSMEKTKLTVKSEHGGV
ncbi:organic solute transporter subunit alpha-like [Arapaima gigas]